MRKNPTSLDDATRAYAKATSSSVLLMIAENKQMDKELQMTMQGGELVTTYTRAELKKAILNELLSLEIVMQELYSKFGTMNKAVVHINGLQQWCARRERILSEMHTTIDYMQTRTMRYKGASLHLPKMMKFGVVELNAHIWSQIQNYEDLPQLITILQASHAWVFRSMDVVFHTHAIPSNRTLIEAKRKARVWMELHSYFGKLMRISPRIELVISTNTMH